jgi:N4-gp56 family major capsid protein
MAFARENPANRAGFIELVGKKGAGFLKYNNVPVSQAHSIGDKPTYETIESLAQNYMDRFTDQSILTHLAGARGFHDNIEWAVPLANDLDFAEILVNPVKAPTKNRHFMSTGSGIETVKAAGNEITIATTDVMNTDLIDALRTQLDSMPIPPPPVIFEGDKMASDSPLRVLLVSSEQYTSILQSNSGQFRTFQANAMARAQSAGQNPLFTGEAGLWNGILIVKMPKPIRFYSGNPINWCQSYTTETETTTDLVPAAFGTGYAVDRALLLGGQALMEAWGKHNKSGFPFFVSEKELDHDDKVEILMGAINGRSKIRFQIDHGDSKQFTDFGVIAIDTAVKLPS